MTREDIIRMAREAELEDSWLGWCQECGCDGEKLSRFAALIAATERQRCADIADQHASIEGIAQKIAAEIRGNP